MDQVDWNGICPNQGNRERQSEEKNQMKVWRLPAQTANGMSFAWPVIVAVILVPGIGGVRHQVSGAFTNDLPKGQGPLLENLLPVPICTALDDLCVHTSTVTAWQVGSHSYRRRGASADGPVALSLDHSGPWRQPGEYKIQLTATDLQGQQATTSCRVRVVECSTASLSSSSESRATPRHLRNIFNASSGAQDAVLSYSCPTNARQPPVVLSKVTAASTVQLTLSAGRSLCILTLQIQTTTSTGPTTALKPIGRSYLGNDWEPYAGDYSTMVFSCQSNGSASFCTTTLPPLPDAASMNYVLTAYQYIPQSPRQDAAARFLEKATFGPTMNEIKLLSLTGNLAAWIQQQQSLPTISSHRQFFRQHATKRHEVPTPMGTVSHPCQQGARYRKYTFVQRDMQALSKVVLSNSTSSKSMLISVRGAVRTVANTVAGKYGTELKPFGEGSYPFCGSSVGEFMGGSVRLKHPTYGCSDMMYFDGFAGNPAIRFTSKDLPGYGPVSLKNAKPSDTTTMSSSTNELSLPNPLSDPLCSSFPTYTGHPEAAVIGTTGPSLTATFWIHTPILILLDNTVDQPLLDGGGLNQNGTKAFDKYNQVRCSNVPRTFLNEDRCFLSASPSACASVEFPDVAIPLEAKNFRTIYQVTGAGQPGTRYVYVMTQLRQEKRYTDPPCLPGSRSRWIPDCSAAPGTNVTSTTRSIFTNLLRQSQDANPFLIDVYLPLNGAKCSANDVNAFDFTVTLNGKCWLNVHPDNYQVFDFTYWTINHPGNSNGFNPIKDFAEKGNTFVFQFPASHTMDRWFNNRVWFSNVGRFGDTVMFKDLPNGLISDEIALAFGSFDIVVNNGAVMVCGSPFEVANQPDAYGPGENHAGLDVATAYNRFTSDDKFISQRTTIWIESALNAPDQLRQRIAWALSQILVISPDSLAVKQQTENFVHYYDIFVRHAFGNYRDIIKEVSYSPMMGEMLSYVDSKSTAFIWETQKLIQSADENFAREVMQLFSIGLVKLNVDGTKQLAADGQPLQCYTNNEITEYARVWTGFSRQRSRGNIEGMTDPDTPNNQIDPMLVNIDWRDHLPKLGLNQRYIGDGWPLCSDLPSQHFLQKGAKFRQLGSASSPQLLNSFSAESLAPTPHRFTLDSHSALFSKLCNATSDAGRSAQCNFEPVVILDETIPCYGDECNVNSLRTIETLSGIFYEYVRPPCVFKAFLGNAQMVKTQSNSSDIMCAEPQADLASTTCCKLNENQTTRVEYFSGERVPMEMAARRCLGFGGFLCPFPTLDDCQTNGGCDPSLHYWSSQKCQIKAKINLDGRVAIVHGVNDSRVEWDDIGSIAQDRTVSFFRVIWTPDPVMGFLANYTQHCLSWGCTIVPFDQTCLCDTNVEEVAPFLDSNPPTRDQVLNELYIGAYLPTTATGIEVNPGVIRYSTGMSAIFQVVDNNGITQLRRNVMSTVTVGTYGAGGPSFRNPVHFISLNDPEVRDAHYETDAALDHYLFHENTAPFLATRLAQRFGISNPSPRYLKAISTAFRSGKYISDKVSVGASVQFGSGTYGDLGATIAAVLLDREASTILLDADPFQGSIQEPFLKVVRLMRSLQYKAASQHPLVRVGVDLHDYIGQEAYKLPNVFSFFNPGYQPEGAITDAGLVSPEAQVLNGPKATNLVNTMLSFVKYGLKSCYGGFGTSGDSCSIGTYTNANGYASYLPSLLSLYPLGVINELATLLTGGRLSRESRLIMETAVVETVAVNSKTMAEALINILQMIILAPEFHVTGLVRNGVGKRVAPVDPPASDKPYKAVIYVFLEGGYDSYSLLVPQQCNVTNSQGQTLLQQYNQQRGTLAFLPAGSERSVVIDATTSNQPCDQFALHDELKVLKQLYDSKDLTFFANTGLINRGGMTKNTYNDLTISQLFAHDAMQFEAQRVDPYSTMPGTGVLGRAADVLSQAGYKTNTIALDNANIAVNPSGTGQAPNPLIIGSSGVSSFTPKPTSEAYFDTGGYVMSLNRKTLPDTNIFAETWSDQFLKGIEDASKLQTYLGSTTLSNVWNPASYAGDADKQYLYQHFQTIAKLTKTHSRRGTDRDFFYMSFGGWDMHGQTKQNIRPKFRALNYGLSLLVQELQAQNLWNNVTIVFTSEFARTMTPNSGDGCDHAWGGNYFMMGGSVRGGRILGQYPSDITPNAPLLIGSGRIIPTTSWDAIWNGIIEWTGVKTNNTGDGLSQCLPNRLNTTVPQFPLFTQKDLYE